MKFVAVAVLALSICGCQSHAPTTDARITELENRITTLEAKNAELQQQNANIAKERNTCNAKFDRSTILYDVGLFNNETRAWVIPADVEPVLAPNKAASYSHYAPKTQTETVHFKAKTGQ